MTEQPDYKVRENFTGRLSPIEGKYLVHPGTCLICARPAYSPEELFANLGVELDHYGVAYLCMNCCAEVSSFIGWVSPREYGRVVETNNSMTAFVASKIDQLQYLRELLDVRINNGGPAVVSSDDANNSPVLETVRKSVNSNRRTVQEQPEFVKPG